MYTKSEKAQKKSLIAGRRIQEMYGNKGSVKCLFLTDGEIRFVRYVFRAGDTIYAYKILIGKQVAKLYSDDRLGSKMNHLARQKSCSPSKRYFYVAAI
jgi:hypothetical protein